MPDFAAIGYKDEDLTRLLAARDAPLPERGLPHSREGTCRYSELYGGKPCPWCQAEQRRAASSGEKKTTV